MVTHPAENPGDTGSEDAVGKRFKLLGAGGGSWRPWMTIVGIVGDVRQMGLDAPARAEMYLPHEQITDHPWFAPRDLAVRVAGEPMGLVRAIKAAIHEVDPGQAVVNVRLFDEILDEEVAARRIGTTLVSAFAALALFLASLGIYGVISYFVVQSTSEFGVRLALGATRRDILVLVLGRGARLAIGGLALGMLGSLALARIVSSLLYGVAATDASTLAAAAMTLAALTGLACLVPALRAIRVDPAAAMRCE